MLLRTLQGHSKQLLTLLIENILKEIEFIDSKNNDENNKLNNLTFVITGSVNNFKNRDLNC